MNDSSPAAWGRARRLWLRLMGSLWFVPGVMILGAGALAVGMIEASTLVDREALVRYPRLFGAGAQSSRDMLATIASAMMTVAGVTFSITVLAVAQASSQYTPRILRNFMRDRPNQLTLGTLTGVFVYCLVVIRTIRGDEELRFIPALAVLMAFVLAVAAIAVLIYFIHHIAESLGASTVLARVRDDTIAAIDRLFPAGAGEGTAAATAHAPAPPAGPWHPIAAARTGYVAHVDAGRLLRCAAAANVVLRMERGVGDHVVRGTPVASWAGTGPAIDRGAVAACFDVGAVRTVEQDAEFGFRQMVDIAVRALSPGVNDTSTAIAAVDAIGAALARLATRREEPPLREYEGTLRLVARVPTFDALLSVAIDEIRRAGEGNVSILSRLLGNLAVVAGCTASASRRARLMSHADRVRDAGRRSVADAGDLAEVERAHERVMQAVAAPAQG